MAVSEGIVPPERIEHYYNIVESHLRGLGVWEETVRKFPPQAIRAAVRRILQIIADAFEAGVSTMEPEELDWGSTFERLRDYDTVDDFVGALQTEGVIPVDRRELALSEAIRVVTEAENIVLKRPEYEELRKFKENYERLERNIKRKTAELEARERAQAEKERRFEEEKKMYKPVKIRFLVDQPPWYRKGTVIETPDFDWALELITKGIAERVEEKAPLPPPKPTKPLMEEVEEALKELERLMS
jgi:hypothetical protein